MIYLLAAYSFFFLLITSYLFALDRRQMRINKEIQFLKELVNNQEKII